MVTFKCVKENCPSKDNEIDFAGDIQEAECGGCGLTIFSANHRPDPEDNE